MAPSPSSIAGTVKTAIHEPMKSKEISSSYDASISAIKPQVPGKPHIEGPPRIPPIASTRKITPIRPVYDDFATAHSSITSRPTNGRSRDMVYKSPMKQTGLLDHGLPLPKRTLISLRRQKKQLRDEALTVPKPAKILNHRSISEFDFDISDAHFTSGRQYESNSSMNHSPTVGSKKRASASPFLNSLKKAMGSKFSPVTNSFQNGPSLQFKLPRDSIELSAPDRKLNQPIPKKSEDSQKEKRSMQQSGDTRQPELHFYLEDPFLYASNQNISQVERVGIGCGKVYGAGLYDQKRPSLHDKRMVHASQGLSHDKTTAQAQQTLDYFHGGIALAVSSQVTSSTREGSTVDNIVKQYARNNGLWDISLDSNDEDSDEDNGYFQHSKLQQRVQGGVSGRSASGLEGHVEDVDPLRVFKLIDFSGRAPGTLLPQNPSLPDQRTLESTPEGFGQSLSYKDTLNLLDITHRSQWVTSTGLSNFQAGAAPHSCRIDPSNNEPFRSGPNQNFTLLSNAAANSSPNSSLSGNMVINTSGSTENPSGIPFNALERDISRTLRRVSAMTNSSQEITAHYQGDGGFQSSTDSSGLLSFIGKPNHRAPVSLKAVTRGFYHESAIRQTWLDSQRIERVRIPICHNVSAASSLLVSYSAFPATDEIDPEELDGLEQNGTEWETVVDGVVSRVKTAGSSLANNSSAGNISPILYEHNDFSSTDRIVQHPAQIDYSHDYRYREIKEGTFPILLPSYKPHTVNGFPANSLRSISPFQQSSADLYKPPPHLSSTHTNPFGSPPPEVISKNSESSEMVDQDRFYLDQPPPLDSGTLQAKKDAQSTHWMDEFGDPGPDIRPTAPTPDLVATNHSMHSLAKSYSGSQIIGSSVADASPSASSTIIYELENLPAAKGQQTLKSKYVARYLDGIPPLARDRAQFIKGPPGAFYQGVRSRPDPRRKDPPLEHKVTTRLPQRKAAQNYPTNQMRPLSLLQVQHTEPTTATNRSRPERRQDGNFLYRSPLAPIKSKSWYNLYTREQINSMHENAKIGDVNDFEDLTRRSSHPAFGEASKLGGSWKRTWSPHLRPWPRENSSIKADLAGRKVKLSSLIFGLSCLFPPMLVLYGVGYLDNMMLWITNGEISSFSKTHKRAALRVVCFFTITILIAVPIIIAVKVIRSKWP
jgi:hypothetical protein